MKLLTIVLAVFLCTSILFGQNPDERQSIELMLHQEINKIKIGGSETNYSPTGFGVKLIIPSSDNLSVILGAGYIGSKIDFNIGDIDQEFTGLYINAGVKIYLSGKKQSDKAELNDKLDYKPDYIPEGFEIVSKYLKGLTMIYSVAVLDLDWSAMEMFGQMQPHAEGGNTIILFFNDIQNTPDISQTGVHFDENFNPHWIATYYRYPNGTDRLIKFPGGKK